MPVLNEAAILPTALKALAGQAFDELVIVDGGSADGSRKIAAQAADADPRLRCLHCNPGRARQMNAGAAQATGEILLFLHADTRLADNAAELIDNALGESNNWGRFDVRLDAPDFMFRVIEILMNRRSRWTGICTGDQGIFVRREVFERLGGYAEIPLMEDVELSRRLKRHGRPIAPAAPVRVSARRWIRYGTWTTIGLMLKLRLLFWIGVEPGRLARIYR